MPAATRLREIEILKANIPDSQIQQLLYELPFILKIACKGQRSPLCFIADEKETQKNKKIKTQQKTKRNNKQNAMDHPFENLRFQECYDEEHSVKARAKQIHFMEKRPKTPKTPGGVYLLYTTHDCCWCCLFWSVATFNRHVSCHEINTNKMNDSCKT